MMDNLNFDQQKEWIKRLAETMNREQLESLMLSYAEEEGIENFRNRAAEEILKITDPCKIIPEIYHEYREIVHDGIFFLLSHFSPERLISLALDQLLMPEDISEQERLIRLAGQIPTLHKLGQIIARNRNLDAAFKKWLIYLENSTHGTDVEILNQQIEEEIRERIRIFSIQTGKRILAEASVGAVLPFTWSGPVADKRSKGVFKILKPMVKARLDEESEILDALALFFHTNRARYKLKNFRFIETFKDIKIALQKEIELFGEQANLKKAFRFYGKDKTTMIPTLLPFSTNNMTAMEYMQGSKITDIDIENKKILAKKLFKAIIWRPLFSREEKTLFHGDPHAGNLFAFEEKNGEVRLILLDWSQAGYLSKRHRLNIFRLTIGVVLEDNDMICEAIKDLSEDDKADIRDKKLKIMKMIHDVFRNQDYKKRQMVGRVFYLIDYMAIQGIQFPKDLLLFRKTFFTVEGVLYDLDPDFNMDWRMLRLLEELFIEEIPRRWAYLLFPPSDSFNHYKSLMSNHDLQILGNRLLIRCLRKSMQLLSVLIEKNTEFMAKFFGLAIPG